MLLLRALNKKMLLSVAVLSMLVLAVSAYAEMEKIEETFSVRKGGILINMNRPGSALDIDTFIA